MIDSECMGQDGPVDADQKPVWTKPLCGGRFRVPEGSAMEDSRLAIKVAVGLEE